MGSISGVDESIYPFFKVSNTSYLGMIENGFKNWFECHDLPDYGLLFQWLSADSNDVYSPVRAPQLLHCTLWSVSPSYLRMRTCLSLDAQNGQFFRSMVTDSLVGFMILQVPEHQTY